MVVESYLYLCIYRIMRLILFVIFLNTAFARPQPVSEDATIITNERESDVFGGYRFSYQTSDAQSREEEGFIKNLGTDNEALSVTGSYSFIGTDGKLYRIFYLADENGFQPRQNKNVNERVNSFIIPDLKFHRILSRINTERQKFDEKNENE